MFALLSGHPKIPYSLKLLNTKNFMDFMVIEAHTKLYPLIYGG